MRYLLPQVENVPTWVVISGPIFFVLFLGLVWWIYRRDRKHVYDKIEKLPLQDD